MLRYAVLLVLVFLQSSMAWADLRADSFLITGARAKNIQMIELALTQGADVNATDEIGRTPLIWTSFRGRSPLIGLLLERGTAVETCDTMGSTGLMRAALAGRVGAADLLLDEGTKTQALDDKCVSAAEWVSQEGATSVERRIARLRSQVIVFCVRLV